MSYLFLRARDSHVRIGHLGAAYQFVSGYGTVTISRRSLKAEQKGLDKALRILDFVIPKTGEVGGDDCHGRLIQRCMQDLVETGQQKCLELVKENARRKFTDPIAKATSDNSVNSDVSLYWNSGVLVEDDPLLLFRELHRKGINMEATTISSIISSCGANGTPATGFQFHAYSEKTGFVGCASVGSSLISLYSKAGRLDDAYRVFEEVHVKNTVSWTAIIAGFAQDWQLETCVYLFNLMRCSNAKPNDFTYATLLSVCTNSASLAIGRSFHCLEMRVGYDSYTHVSNALISMYAKCGVIEEARYVFEKLPYKDLISWNSMIFGYAHCGIADEALDLLKEMERRNVLPDAISFLGVLSSCRHTGLADTGRQCFNTMLLRGIKPQLDHYSCIIDLLGRAGLLEEAVVFIRKMPIPPNAVIWGSIVSACRVHGNVWIGIHAAEKRLLLEPGCAATYVQLANLYASIGQWDNVAKVRKLMKERGLKTTPGYSWIEIGKTVYRFKAEDATNSELEEIIIILDSLGDHMQCLRPMFETPLADLDQMVYQ